MKKSLVFLIVIIVLLIPSGIVFAQDNCPDGDGWTCKKVKEGFSTVGVFIVQTSDFPIVAIWIDGTVYEENTAEGCFYIRNLGTKEISVFSACESIKWFSLYAPIPITATVAIITPTSTATVTPSNTAHPITSTPEITKTSTTVPIINNGNNATNPVTLFIVVAFAIAAIIILVALLTRKKH